MRKTLMLAITLVLSACGGNKNNLPAPANTPPAPVSNQNIKPTTTPAA